ncbi:hypothetical protein O181_002001 [Austropuccinia psidii MF-1]|uniref:Uncharacterized protein n=1 Tax=Austropuccinia psidii MF-1 TaxID=1389203 RepID=A0A9Q3BB74_9BASI|nr:hypothetical protein [Austropuccinia psidii MF-1]
MTRCGTLNAHLLRRILPLRRQVPTRFNQRNQPIPFDLPQGPFFDLNSSRVDKLRSKGVRLFELRESNQVAKLKENLDQIALVNLEPLHVYSISTTFAQDSYKRRLSILASSWIYSHLIGGFEHETENLKQKYAEVAKMAMTIQNMVNRMRFAFAEEMPQHVWFINYGDRIFPHLLSKYLEKKGTNEILKFEKDALAKWILAIGCMRDLDAKIPKIKLFLASKSLVELVNSMIRADWEMESILLAIRHVKLFTIKHNKIVDDSQENVLKKIEWFVNGLLGTASLLGEISLDRPESLTALLKGSLVRKETGQASNSIRGKTSSFAPTAPLSTKRSDPDLTWKTSASENFLDLLKVVLNTKDSSTKAYSDLSRCQRAHSDGDPNLVSNMMAAAFLTTGDSVELPKLPLRAELTDFQQSLALIQRGKDWIEDLNLKELTEGSSPLTEKSKNSIKNAKANVLNGNILSDEVQALLYLLSINENYPLTTLAFQRYVATFKIAALDDKLQSMVFKEILPIIAWESDLVIPRKDNTWRSLLQHSLSYILQEQDHRTQNGASSLRKKIIRFANDREHFPCSRPSKRHFKKKNVTPKLGTSSGAEST